MQSIQGYGFEVKMVSQQIGGAKARLCDAGRCVIVCLREHMIEFVS